MRTRSCVAALWLCTPIRGRPTRDGIWELGGCCVPLPIPTAITQQIPSYYLQFFEVCTRSRQMRTSFFRLMPSHLAVVWAVYVSQFAFVEHWKHLWGFASDVCFEFEQFCTCVTILLSGCSEPELREQAFLKPYLIQTKFKTCFFSSKWKCKKEFVWLGIFWHLSITVMKIKELQTDLQATGELLHSVWFPVAISVNCFGFRQHKTRDVLCEHRCCCQT